VAVVQELWNQGTAMILMVKMWTFKVGMKMMMCLNQKYLLSLVR
jgi:hypothetical protein